MPDDKSKRTKKTPRDEKALPSPASLPSLPATEGFIPPHGGYEQLHSFQKARIVYDGTVKFCDRFVDRKSRTHDQMVQAARSGKQNILEGSQASGTSKETEIKLTNVARASLEELLEDYRDFLRVRGIPFGKRTPEKPSLSENSVPSPMRRMSPIGPISTPAPAMSWPTSSSASSTRPPTCSTNNSAASSRIFSRKAACASA